MMRLSAFLVCVLITALTVSATHADIYQWEWVDPGDTTQGRRQSSILAPDGLGREATPGAHLYNLDLTRAWLRHLDLRDVSFTGSVLRDADFSGALIDDSTQLFANLQGANFTEARVTGHAFRGGFVALMGANLAGANFTRADLRDLDLIATNLLEADFTSADIRGALLSTSSDPFFFRIYGGPISERRSFTSRQLYETASYRERDLTDLWVSGDLRGWDFGEQRLLGARLRGNLTGVDFTRANLTDATLAGDLRGAKGLCRTELINHATETTIHPDGFVEELTGDVTLWDYDASPGLPIRVHRGYGLGEYTNLTLVLEDSQWGSTITFQPGAEVRLGGELVLVVEPDENLPLEALVGNSYQLFDWTDVSPVGAFDSIVLHAGTDWDTSKLYITGEVTLVGTVPEPTGLVLINLLSSGWIVYRCRLRRRRRACAYAVLVSQAIVPAVLAKFNSMKTWLEPVQCTLKA